jgi:hypothetical protein
MPTMGRTLLPCAVGRNRVFPSKTKAVPVRNVRVAQIYG